MGKNYDTDAELRSIEMWVCKTCGKCWPTKARDSNWTASDAEEAARVCCSENSICHICKERRTRYPHRACEVCSAIRHRERWEACEVRPLEFPLALQDDDRWFHDEDELTEYCEEHELKAEQLLLRIGERTTPRILESDFWCDDISEDHDPCDNDEFRSLADKMNAWAKEHIITYNMGPFRPDRGT